MTIVFLILRILANPFANALQKKIVQKDSAILSNFYIYLTLSIACLPFCSEIINLSKETYIYALSAGLFCATGTVCLVKALELGELSVLGPINSYKCIIGMFSAFLLVGEVPSIQGLFGMMLIIYGSKFIFEQNEFSFKLFKRKDIQLRFLALLLSGIEAGFLKKVIILSSPQVSFYMWCIFGAFFSFIILILSRKKLSKPTGINKYILVAISLAIMQLSTNIVFKKMDVSLALALFQLSSLITVFIGYKIFNEKNVKKKLLGTFIMISGAILILK